MDHRRDDTVYPVFVRFGAQRGSGLADKLVSRAAVRLHVCAVLASIEAGRPGLITDQYLDAVLGETSVGALELCTAGLWERVGDGYEVLESETARMAGEVHRQLQELSDRCRATGGHLPDDEDGRSCRGCGVRLDA